MRKVIKEAIYYILVFVVIVGALELSLRFRRVFVGRSAIVADRELGWVNNVKRKQDLVTVNACGETISRKFTNHKYINKVPSDKTKTKILFLGDSFTEGFTVSTKDAYYNVFERLTEGEYSVYSAGLGGYGTLQEYLLLEKIFDEIRPDILIWQLCANDIYDNFYLKNNYNDVLRPRPYLNLKTGEIKLKANLLANLRRSVLFDKIYKIIVKNIYDGSLPNLSTPQELKEAEIQGSLILSHLVKTVKKQIPETRIIGFAAEAKFDDYYADIFTSNDLSISKI